MLRANNVRSTPKFRGKAPALMPIRKNPYSPKACFFQESKVLSRSVASFQNEDSLISSTGGGTRLTYEGSDTVKPYLRRAIGPTDANVLLFSSGLLPQALTKIYRPSSLRIVRFAYSPRHMRSFRNYTMRISLSESRTLPIQRYSAYIEFRTHLLRCASPDLKAISDPARYIILNDLGRDPGVPCVIP